MKQPTVLKEYNLSYLFNHRKGFSAATGVMLLRLGKSLVEYSQDAFRHNKQ